MDEERADRSDFELPLPFPEKPPEEPQRSLLHLPSPLALETIWTSIKFLPSFLLRRTHENDGHRMEPRDKGRCRFSGSGMQESQESHWVAHQQNPSLRQGWSPSSQVPHPATPDATMIGSSNGLRALPLSSYSHMILLLFVPQDSTLERHRHVPPTIVTD
ncbi:hypothetical protein MMC09_003544 [Bachmanniomyces sp. S44760]|nr:hypothetical protein [Bachmanniomyces sp. S44760]